MKARSGRRLLSLLVITASISTVSRPGSVQAATSEYWNPGGLGGTGIWGTSPGDKNWNLIAGASSGNTVWPDTGNEVAVFQDAIGGTVTVFTPVQAAGIIQQNANYAIDAATITLVQDAAAANPFVQVQTGTLTIASVLDGTHGLITSGPGNLVLSSANTYTGTTSLTAGTLTLNGSLASTTLEIAAGATLVDSTGGLDAATAVTNAGNLTVNAADTVASYIQNPGGELAGSAALTVTGTAALTGGTVSGHLLGSTTSSGPVLVSGTLGGGSLAVTGGTLTLTGTATNNTVGIAAGATLVDSTGGLDAAAAVTNAGNLTVNAADTVASYTQNAGTLAGSAALTVTGTAALTGGTVSGSLLGNTINLAGGVLTNTGTLGTATTHLDIAAGATLVAAGTQHYSLLTTSGTGVATWQGNLTNTTTLAPGAVGGIGTLAVTNGNFANAAGAVLKLDIAAASHDLLGTTATASFNGTLDLNQVGTAVAAFVPIQVVVAAAYSGNFTNLTENLDGAVMFNPGNGTVIRIAVPQGATLFGSTGNQSSTWAALYDDVIDPGVTNVFAIPGGNPSYNITSGIANGNNPDLLWALASSFTPTGLDASLLNHLSPEVYAGLSDYAIQATRAHQRSAFSAPALEPAPNAVAKSDSKGGSKDAAPVPGNKSQWELFAAADFFNVRSAGSQNQADYEISDYGILAGVRTKPTERVQLAAYLAGDTGNIDGALISADSTGWSLGVIGDALLEPTTNTHLSAGISYGRYYFDGTRSSVSATGSGWIPAPVGFSNATADSLELFVGIDGLLYHNDHFRLIPAFAVRGASGTLDSFSEASGAAPGSPIALAVSRNNYNSVLADLSLRAEADLSSKLAVWGQLGMTSGIGDNPQVLTARFVKGSRPFQASADGLSNDTVYLGLGASYKINDSISVALGYRVEYRSEDGNYNGVSLSSSFRF